MARLIDADALVDALKPLKATGGHKYYRDGVDWVLHEVMPNIIAKQPTIEVAPVVHGRWFHDWNNLYVCSECGSRETMSPKKLKNYCPSCGAKMDSEG